MYKCGFLQGFYYIWVIYEYENCWCNFSDVNKIIWFFNLFCTHTWVKSSWLSHNKTQRVEEDFKRHHTVVFYRKKKRRKRDVKEGVHWPLFTDYSHMYVHIFTYIFCRWNFQYIHCTAQNEERNSIDEWMNLIEKI